MKVLALIALIACASAGRVRRTETVSQGEKDSVICVMTQCSTQFQSVTEALKEVFGNLQGNINAAKFNKACDDYKSLEECTNNLDCDMTPGMKDAFDMMDIITFVCNNHKAAFVKYGTCIINALKGDGVKNGCEHMGKPEDFQHLATIGQRSLRRMRRQTAQQRQMLEALITPGLQKIKESARKIPAIDCTTLTVMDACIKDRVQYKCNADGTGDAAELAEAVFKKGITGFLKGIEGLTPDRSDHSEAESCFATRFWFW